MTSPGFNPRAGLTKKQTQALVDASAANIGVMVTSAVADGTTDVTTALQADITAAAAAKRILLLPPGSYKTTAPITGANSLIISAYGAIGLVYDTNLGDGSAGRPWLDLTGCTDVIVQGLEINGRKASWAASEYKHGIQLDNSKRILIEDCYLHDCKGDGIAMNAFTHPSYSENVTLRRVRCTANHRGGFSASGKNVNCYSCAFDSNGGTNPDFGVDIEPDFDDVTVDGIHFWGCTFNGNTNGTDSGEGLVIDMRTSPSVTQGNITLTGCDIRNNFIMGAIIREVTGCAMKDCAVSNNGSDGILARGVFTDLLIDGCSILDNTRNGIYCSDTAGSNSNLKIVNNRIKAASGQNGIRLANTVDDVLIDGNTITGGAYNVRIDADTVTNVRFGPNTMSGASTAKTLGLTAVRVIPNATLTASIGDATNVISTGIVYGQDSLIPYDCVPLGWDIVDPQALGGSTVADAWMDTYANYPPTVADSVAGSEKPTLSTASKSQDTALTTWGQLLGGRWLRWNVDSATTTKMVQIGLKVARTG